MQTEREIVEILKGYAGDDADKLEHLVARTDWQDLAKWELARRGARLLRACDDETVKALSEGKIEKIDLLAICRTAATQQQKARCGGAEEEEEDEESETEGI